MLRSLGVQPRMSDGSAAWLRALRDGEA
jgi:hypothetical protein